MRTQTLSAQTTHSTFLQERTLHDDDTDVLPCHIIAAIVTLGATGSTQMLTVGICQIPICIRLFRLLHKLDELSTVGYFRVVQQNVRLRHGASTEAEGRMPYSSILCDRMVYSACAPRGAGGALGRVYMVDDRREHLRDERCL